MMYSIRNYDFTKHWIYFYKKKIEKILHCNRHCILHDCILVTIAFTTVAHFTIVDIYVLLFIIVVIIHTWFHRSRRLRCCSFICYCYCNTIILPCCTPRKTAVKRDTCIQTWQCWISCFHNIIDLKQLHAAVTLYNG